MLARAHSLVRSVVGPGSSTRSHSPRRLVSPMASKRAWPSPKMRNRHSGSRSAMRPNAAIRWGHCFSDGQAAGGDDDRLGEQRARAEARRERVGHDHHLGGLGAELAAQPVRHRLGQHRDDVGAAGVVEQQLATLGRECEDAVLLVHDRGPGRGELGGVGQQSPE